MRLAAENLGAVFEPMSFQSSFPGKQLDGLGHVAVYLLLHLHLHPPTNALERIASLWMRSAVAPDH